MVTYLGNNQATTTKVNSAVHPSKVAKSSISFGWGEGRKVTAARWWQTTLCNPIWHVISRSGEMIHMKLLYPLYMEYVW